MKHSYIVVSKDIGIAVLEFFDKSLTRHINTEKYTVMTAMDYLYEFNSHDHGGLV